MTNAELVTLLQQYSADMAVKVACGHIIRPIERVDTVIDIDTNVVSIEIVAEDETSVC